MFGFHVLNVLQVLKFWQGFDCDSRDICDGQISHIAMCNATVYNLTQ